MQLERFIHFSKRQAEPTGFVLLSQKFIDQKYMVGDPFRTGIVYQIKIVVTERHQATGLTSYDRPTLTGVPVKLFYVILSYSLCLA